MDDWKLKSTPVVRIERPNKTFVYAVPIFFFQVTTQLQYIEDSEPVVD